MNANLSLIIEDDPHSTELLRHFIEKLPFFTPPHTAASGAEALQRLHTYEYDLVFLDINLPDINGKTLLEGMKKRPAIIVTTSSLDYAADFYDLDIADYLIKPLEFSRFLRAVNRAFNDIKINDNVLAVQDSVYLKVGRKMQKFNYQNIDYIEAYGIYSKIWQNNQVTVVNEPIANLAEYLPGKYFLRVHKSYIINVSKITSFDHREVEINQFKIQIGVSYKARLKALMDLINKK